ncbi:MAG: SEC-C domain-containing protein [Proteobacteria bacterium]|nr:SEC-C domain-containing protein [Pseudomonadota bacterium]MBU1738267.1 SEC-C domain-containing protein [Pseudomonadota bacterium]
MHDDRDGSNGHILERFLFDAVAELLRHEDEEKFFAWMRRNTADYLFIDGLPANEEMDKHFAATMARMLWDVTPLPGHNFQTRPGAAPERNSPCPCGSGKKYKQCCRQFESSTPALTSDQMWPVVIGLLSPSELERACASGNAPLEALGAAAERLLAEDKPKKALQIIEPLFRSPANFKKKDMDLLFEMLLYIYEQLGYSGKKIQMIDRIIEQAPRSPLRGSAFQRRAAICMDGGDDRSAWHYFQRAQQDNPDDPSNGVLEINLLVAESRFEKAKARAGFWLKKCGKLKSVAEVTEDFFREASSNPQNLFSDIAIGMAGGAGGRLKKWLAEVSGRKLPSYTFTKETIEMPGPPPEEKRKPEQQSLFTTFSREEHDDGDGLSESAGEETAFSCESIILEPPGPVRTVEKQWRNRFNFSKPFSIHLQTRGEFDPWDPDLEKEWCDFLDRHPEAFDSLEILDDIAGAVEIHPEGRQPWIMLELSPGLLQRASEIIKLALADEPDAVVTWLISANRPALRLLYRHYLYIMHHGDIDESLVTGQWLLRLNPTDNHGIREDVINELLKAGADEQALALAMGYPNDLILATSLGKALALYRLQRMDEAKKALGEAVRRNRHAVDSLVRERVGRPKVSEMGISIGGRDQAWIYRQDMRNTWQETPGAIDWLKKTASRLKKESEKKKMN